MKPREDRDSGKKRHRFQGKIKVPVGMEKLLFHAAKDEEFKKRLLSDRQAAIAESGVKLRPSEEEMLKVVSNSALETMIANIEPENPRRRKFMGLVAAAAASLAAGTIDSACNNGESRGIRPDDDDNDDDTVDSDQHDLDTGAGIGPDADVDSDTDGDTDTVDSDYPNADAGGIGPDTDVDGDTDSDTNTDTDTDTDTDTETDGN